MNCGKIPNLFLYPRHSIIMIIGLNLGFSQILILLFIHLTCGPYSALFPPQEERIPPALHWVIQKGLLKLECAWESPGDLMKSRFWLSRSGLKLRICVSNKFLGDARAAVWGPQVEKQVPRGPFQIAAYM